jgi:putative ABC transport system permease protein
MLPGLLAPLLTAMGLALGFVVLLVIFRPVLRRLALRQIARRPIETVLVIAGSLLGTTLIVASLSVGDSFDRSVRQVAYDVLGPVDEYVRVADPALAASANQKLAALSADPRIDGMLLASGEPATAVARPPGALRAEPRALVWQMPYDQAARFGGVGNSGLAVSDPGDGGAVINSNLADALRAQVGDRILLYLYGRDVPVVIKSVVPAKGLAGLGLGASVNRDAFVSPGTLERAAAGTGRHPATTLLISNRGGVESGVALTGPVRDALTQSLGALGNQGVTVSTPKREVLDSANRTGAQLGSLFLFIASFSIIAGIMLVVLIFVMLAEERKGQLGMLRAIGMRRRRVTASFAIEGAVYAGVAAVLGAALGIGVGRVVVLLAMSVINNYNQADNKLTVTFAVTRTSILNGIAAGFLVAFLAVVVTSIRIARTNIIAAIRDLEPSPGRRARRRMSILSAIGVTAFSALSVPVVAHGVGPATYLLPALAAVSAVPLLARVMPASAVYSATALAVLLWGLFGHLVRPRIYDDASTGTYVVMGSMLVFAAVVLVSLHQNVLLWPIKRIVNRPSESGLAARIAIAYPTAKRFRTGATLAMYSIVVLVIVLMTQIKAVIDSGVNQGVRDATAGWSLRVDSNPGAAPDQNALLRGTFAGRVAEAAPLVIAPAFGDDPLRRRTDPLPVLAVGIPDALGRTSPALQSRLGTLPDDSAAWNLVLHDRRYVLLDAFYGATGGPQGKQIQPGSRVTVSAPTGKQSYLIAGIVKSGLSFYGIGGGEFRYPVLMAPSEVRTTFPHDARAGSWLLSLAPGINPRQVADDLQAAFVRNGVVATDLQAQVRDSFAANRRFFLLMQGYLALGLLVGICGLGVIMVRAVRERRRTIGVLRALGFRARTVQWAFLAESALVAFEGVLVGAVLGVLNTWLLYLNSPAFGSLDTPFPIAWREISITVGATLFASLLVTFGPARRAAHIRPAIAVRVAD